MPSLLPASPTVRSAIASRPAERAWRSTRGESSVAGSDEASPTGRWLISGFGARPRAFSHGVEEGPRCQGVADGEDAELRRPGRELVANPDDAPWEAGHHDQPDALAAFLAVRVDVAQGHAALPAEDPDETRRHPDPGQLEASQDKRLLRPVDLRDDRQVRSRDLDCEPRVDESLGRR